MRISAYWLIAAMVMVFPAAAQQAVEYSADALEKDPRSGEREGRIYVGNNRMRTEMAVNGKKMVQVVDMQRQLVMMINTDDKTYVRQQAAEGESRGNNAVTRNTDPCAGMQNVSCKKAGIETVNGNPAVKWEISSQSSQAPGGMVFWIDEKRGFPVRQQMPGGSMMEMKFTGEEQLAGRRTEKWSRTITGPDGKSRVSSHWYDPELNAMVREEQPGGYTRLLTNIKVGPQADALFEAPADYREISSGK